MGKNEKVNQEELEFSRSPHLYEGQEEGSTVKYRVKFREMYDLPMNGGKIAKVEVLEVLSAGNDEVEPGEVRAIKFRTTKYKTNIGLNPFLAAILGGVLESKVSEHFEQTKDNAIALSGTELIVKATKKGFDGDKGRAYYGDFDFAPVRTSASVTA